MFELFGKADRAKKLQGTQTLENLKKAFEGESQAHNKYRFFAKVAARKGYHQIADIFEETARHEMTHSRLWFTAMRGEMPEIEEILKEAANGENFESTDMYTKFAAKAKEEGFEDIAYWFHKVGEIESRHEKRFLSLLHLIDEDRIFEKEQKVTWICKACGNFHLGTKAPDACPVCGHPQGFFYTRSSDILQN